MKIDLSRHAPPGMELKEEKTLFTVGMSLSMIFSAFYFGSRYSNALSELYWRNGTIRTLKDGAIMIDFVEILGEGLLGFLIVSALMIAAAVMHYVYHFYESKSIYTMRRLPSRWELHRRCLTLPAVGLVIIAITAMIFLGASYAIYMNMTPDVCLTPGQWQKIWSV